MSLASNHNDFEAQRRALDAHAIVSETDLNGIITYANDLFCEISQYSREELIGKSHRIVNSGIHSQDFFRKMWDDILGGATWRGEMCNRAKNGQIYWVDSTIVSVQNDAGFPIAFISVRTDITAIKKQTEALRESEERFRFAFQTSPDIINLTKLNGEYVEINDSFTRIAGYTRKDCIGKTSVELNIWAVPEDRAKLLEGLQTAGQVNNLESKFRYKDGRVHTALMSAKYITLNGEKLILSTTRDIEDKKQLELEKEVLFQELQHRQQELESLVYAMSHDLRAPLVNVLGFVRELNSELDLYSKASGDAERELLAKSMQESMKYIASSAARMDTLQNGVLRFARLGRREYLLKTVEMGALLQRILLSLEHQIRASNATITVQIDNDSLGDESALEQVFSNLIDNAIKYGRAGVAPEIQISSQLEGSEVVYTVADNGRGIPLQFHARVFEMFHRLNTDNSILGEGLGLTLVRGLLYRINGSISILPDQERAGVVFQVRLPRTGIT